MYDIPDNELDDLLKRSLKDPDVSFDPESWKAMERLLDNEDKKPVAIYYAISAGITIIALLSIAIFFKYTRGPEPGKYLAETANIKTTSGTDTTRSGDKKNNRTRIFTEKEFKTGKGKKTSTAKIRNERQENNFSPETHVLSAQSKKSYEKIRNRTERAILRDENRYTSGSHPSHIRLSGQSPSQGTEANLPAISEKENSRQEAYANEPVAQNSSQAGKPDTTDVPVLKAALIAASYRDEKKEAPADKAGENNAETKNIRALKGPVIDTTELPEKKETQAVKINKDTPDTTVMRILKDPVIVETVFGDKKEKPAGEMDKDTPDTTDMQALKDAAITKTDTAEKKGKQVEKHKIRVSLNFLAGPDFSTTRDIKFYKAGYNLGILPEIYISGRISFSTGILFGRKIYTSEGYDYASDENFWPNAIRPEDIHARCAVLDIPVNVRYKFLIKEKSNFFISTGISSYVMLHEKYNFNYETDEPGLLQFREVKNQNTHFFKILNLSFGYEKYIGKNCSIQIEPYSKLPFGGIGDGKTKLISAGLYVSLKYFLR